MFVTAEQLGTSVTVEQIATGNGLHVDLDENGVLSLVLWGIEMDDDIVLFEAKITPEQVERIHKAETDDMPFLCQKCSIVQ
jgi:hypothetical protein